MAGFFDNPTPKPPGGLAGGDMSRWRNAIASIEGNYDSVNRDTGARGRYQVIPGNIPSWSQAAIGRAVTPDEFLADPKIQDAVFDHKIGGYLQKYGPAGAARAWFAGEGGMNNLAATDANKMSVAGYEAKFNKAVGLPGKAPEPPPESPPEQAAPPDDLWRQAPDLGPAKDSSGEDAQAVGMLLSEVADVVTPKATRKSVTPEDVSQMISYLRAAGDTETVRDLLAARGVRV